MSSKLIKVTRIEEFDDGKIITTVTEYPTAKPGEIYYLHDDGRRRSVGNRWFIAMHVDCRECKVLANDHCISRKINEFTVYPHNSRFRDGLALVREQFPESQAL